MTVEIDSGSVDLEMISTVILPIQEGQLSVTGKSSC